MKLISNSSVLLKEKEYKPKKAKKGQPEVSQNNPAVVGEATVFQSNDSRLKKGDRVLINRMGNLEIEIGKTKYVLTDVEDVLVKL
jgi:co-chaperonin GroES (HSP10)